MLASYGMPSTAWARWTIKALRKATKLRSDKELFAAIGWLAKEGKLLFDESGEELLVELTY